MVENLFLHPLHYTCKFARVLAKMVSHTILIKPTGDALKEKLTPVSQEVGERNCRINMYV